MNRLRRTLSFRNRKKEKLSNNDHSSSLPNKKEKQKITNESIPLQWQEDEKNVRTGTCSFYVKVRQRTALCI